MANWRAASPDLVQGYWFKMIHTRLQEYMQDSICQGNVPEWMIIGRRVLIQKDPAKVNQASNYRPIACLPIIWKLLTEIMGEKLYQHLERDRLLVDEQKGCIKGTRGTKDQLPVDKTVLKNCQRRLTNLSMAWIDYKKTFDMVPHSWVLKCLEMVGAAINMISLITNSMVSWRRGEVDIRKGIFLSPQYYVDNRLAN